MQGPITLHRSPSRNLEPGRGERESLPNTIRLKFGIVPEKIIPIRIDRHSFPPPGARSVSSPGCTGARSSGSGSR